MDAKNIVGQIERDILYGDVPKVPVVSTKKSVLDVLTTKVGPLPVYGWCGGVLGVVAFFGIRRLLRGPDMTPGAHWWD